MIPQVQIEVTYEHSSEFPEPLTRTSKSLTETTSVLVAWKMLKQARFWEKPACDTLSQASANERWMKP